jgi:di/tricarboxylate transporter
MSDFLDFLAREYNGLLVLGCALSWIILAILIVAWIFGLGRFGIKNGKDQRQTLVFVIATFFTKLIDDFRHLLALVVMVIFAGAFLAVLHFACSLDEAKEGLQAVAATMGGLVGSIIGYYFGESAAAKRGSLQELTNGPSSGAQAIQSTVEEIEKAPEPPGLESKPEGR